MYYSTTWIEVVQYRYFFLKVVLDSNRSTCTCLNKGGRMHGAEQAGSLAQTPPRQHTGRRSRRLQAPPWRLQAKFPAPARPRSLALVAMLRATAHRRLSPRPVCLRPASLAMEVAAPVPAVSKIRVTVTATNGIADARINEVRLYDAAGVISFPSKSKRTP